jgi:hypothetical protein
MKILPMEVELFHAEEQTDRWTEITKPVSRFAMLQPSIKAEVINLQNISYIDKKKACDLVKKYGLCNILL